MKAYPENGEKGENGGNEKDGDYGENGENAKCSTTREMTEEAIKARLRCAV
jgi:hypothetical protein